MKLLSLKIRCGGKLGCGMEFVFPEGTTTETAAKTLREHCAEPDHMKLVLMETNTRRTLDGLAPLTMDELLGREAPTKPARKPFNMYDEVKEGVL